MSNPLTEDYLRWLGPQIRDEERSPKYWDLFRAMFEKEFEWKVHNDDNRLQDGKDLRDEFCYANHIRMGSLRNLGQARFIEVLIGLSRRMSYQASGTAQGWAWQFVINLELNRMSDRLGRRKLERVDNILDTVIWRTYTPDGVGGFFPLTRPDEDQTQKELWYQMMAYIDELNPGR